jgi:hypothetical protein
MFDNLHSGMANMRNELLTSIHQLFDQKFAVLESRIRDCAVNIAPKESVAPKESIEDIKAELHDYVHSELNSVVIALMKKTYDDLDDFKNKIRAEFAEANRESKVQGLPIVSSPSISHNLVVERKQDEIEEDTKTIMISEDVDVEVESAAEVEEDEDEDEENKFSPLKVGDKTYWLDQNLVVYKEIDDGYVEIGTYDAESGELDIVDDDDDEEEGAVETTEFTYKGKTYLRDEDNNVYNEDGEEIGIWTGTVVKFSIRSA